MKNIKITIYISILVAVLLPTTIVAQTADDIKYRRSSLHVMLMEDNDLNPQYKKIIVDAFLNAEFPDKYDNHDIGIASHDILSIVVPESQDTEEAEEKSKEEENQDKRLKGVDKKIEKFIIDEKVAAKLVAKWFNRKDDGSFSTELIAERGSYDATTLDVSKAKMQSNSVSTQMEDAGYELIGNTFLIVNKANFIENEVGAAIVYEAAKLGIATMKQENAMQKMVKDAASAAAEALYERTRKGYTVGTRSFLYKLTWNDSIYKIFSSQHVVTKSMNDSMKMRKAQAFDNSDLYSMEFVGMEKATVMVLNLKAENLTTQQIISEATIRTGNKVFAKLQKEYDVFKPKTPLFQVEKKGKLCTAKIGLKEGLEGGEKFDLLEQFVNKEGLTGYKSIGTIKVDKKNIWDNQFYASKPPVIEGEIKVQATHFKGCKKKHYAGLLIRQKK
tara:strand:- start:241 stop:1572 length:1332 start_codon:yes stop_codon:yes gene_type:complete